MVLAFLRIAQKSWYAFCFRCPECVRPILFLLRIYGLINFTAASGDYATQRNMLNKGAKNFEVLVICLVVRIEHKVNTPNSGNVFRYGQSLVLYLPSDFLSASREAVQTDVTH